MRIPGKRVRILRAQARGREPGGVYPVRKSSGAGLNPAPERNAADANLPGPGAHPTQHGSRRAVLLTSASAEIGAYMGAEPE